MSSIIKAKRVDSGQVFDLYYDREIKDANDRIGHWFLYRELREYRSEA